MSVPVVLSRCPGCRSREVEELAAEDDGDRWLRLRCRSCRYEWAARC